MQNHIFHIPVLGLGYSIDTPLKVARYGISSVLSIVDDELIERMREYHCKQNDVPFTPISKQENDSRAKRITAYLNFLDKLIDEDFKAFQLMPFEQDNDLKRYFDLLPESSVLRQGYDLMLEYPDGERKKIFQQVLKKMLVKGSIDVNIMAKVDKLNFDAEGNFTGEKHTDALSALRGFANSNLQSSLILSAGMNPKLYSYMEEFGDFFPDEKGKIRKKIILKVSDYRSALIQAKFLAKKGLWVSEFRIESGLNCGGHAFATDGLLLGPILEEFKQNRQQMAAELWEMCKNALWTKGYQIAERPIQRITAQGGIGTAQENDFLINYYQLDGTGWGSPFLLVPEVTNVDESTLNHLTASGSDDYYLSDASPLGVLFNNFKSSTIEEERMNRIEKGRPGSPCTKKYLCTNTEFTEEPICTASRKYQHYKIQELEKSGLDKEQYTSAFEAVTAKVCLCEGLCASVYLKNGMLKPKESKAVAICPGPNLAYFKRSYTLDEMTAHIYGKINLLKDVTRPHVFINELNLYVDYLRKSVTACLQQMDNKKGKQLQKFRQQLQQGINYYEGIANQLASPFNEFHKQLIIAQKHLNAIACGIEVCIN
ncbi:hypothetical protein [Mucilaginibacter sp. KACC 22063]|uniref:hypothetical protein n=1 Tax=Mucilaginibacter sp. KACC 22063 TaxID=3025666 RepID=UPI002365D6CA|nr:hypothetical protein [Mucilaginibacter sp. KACC 22063]WDF57401.1 hypothetical protein PQ461_10070 [Mucilaginibacter sp. KACC 22063]